MTSTRTEIPPENSTQSFRRVPRRRLVLASLAVIIIVLSVVAAVVLLGGNDDDEFESIAENFDGEHKDFADPPWSVLIGDWSQNGGVASVDLGSAQRGFAIQESAEADVIVRARFRRTAAGAGLTFRYVDPDNFWAVIAAPYYATWNVVRFVDGEGRVVTNTGLTLLESDTVIDVRLSGDIITVWIDGVQRREVIDVTEQPDGPTLVGLIAADEPAEPPEPEDPEDPEDQEEPRESPRSRSRRGPETARWDAFEVQPLPE